MPSLVKLAEKRASGQVTRRFAVIASPSPPPIAGPCTAATNGVATAHIRAAAA